MLGAGELQFSGPIVGICGPNGVGKSTLLSLLHKILNPNAAPALVTSREITQFAVDEVDACIGSQEIEAPETLKAYVESRGACAKWIDCAAQATEICKLVVLDANFLDDITTQNTPSVYGNDLLSDISYLIGKKYTSCRVFEIADYDGFDVFPYFEVVSDGIAYRSEHMGKGELSALLAYWHMKSAQEDSVLLFEEPEAHLPVRSQLYLMNLLAREVGNKRLFVVISSHSPAILGRLSHSDLSVLSRVGGVVDVSNTLPPALLHDMFGVVPRIRAILLVEDWAAAHFLRELLESQNPELGAEIEISNAGSSGEIVGALERFPQQGLTTVKVGGMFDGDMRQELKKTKYAWQNFFLPGNVAPELLFIEYMQSPESVSALAVALQVCERTLRAALAQLTCPVIFGPVET
jgi:predicted ATPase